DIDTLIRALELRLNYFITMGCTAADISFENFPNAECDREGADICLKARLNGEAITSDEADKFRLYVICSLMKLFAKKNIVLQIHTGVVRNQNTKRFAAIGADSGIDSVGNALDIVAGARLFDLVENECGLPKTIVYTLNANSYYPLATMIGDFAGDTKGKMQLGAAWWFMDHRDGIKEQLRIFANTSGLGLFNGMLTDSRSFVSYARHDYFRRILCSVLAKWVEAGEYPDDGNLVELAKNIAYYNAKNFFGGNI
ncbi:MAG: glucuronate isomerase, partial [Clostridia bacterium]|nr:glucuronate isomerase [Clostridia bacterium]